MKKIFLGLWMTVFCMINIVHAELSYDTKIKINNSLANLHAKLDKFPEEKRIEAYELLKKKISTLQLKYTRGTTREVLMLAMTDIHNAIKLTQSGNKVIEDPLENITPKFHTTIVDTAQDKCYSDLYQTSCAQKWQDFYGQDAQFATQNPKYIDHGNGTVSDSVTGLMWTQLPWNKMTYDEAVEKIDENYYFAGFNDWRIPSIKELYSLMDFRWVDPDPTSTETWDLIPFIDTEYFHFEYGDTDNWDRIIDSQWITSSKYTSTVMQEQECFFGVNFADGRIKCYPIKSRKNNWYYLRLVRWKPYGINDMVNNNNGSVTDNNTWLTWQQWDSKSAMNWKDALSYCENLKVGWHSDWHLPNAKELQSIVDYWKGPDKTNSPAIAELLVSSSIKNEAWETDYPYFWTSTTHKTSKWNGSKWVYIAFGRATWNMGSFGWWVDVHGAWAQRSDPKSGDPTDYKDGLWPQWDSIRINNHVRCVRNNAQLIHVDSQDDAIELPFGDDSLLMFPDGKVDYKETKRELTPPEEASNACKNKTLWSLCWFKSPMDHTILWTCKWVQWAMVCIPK